MYCPGSNNTNIWNIHDAISQWLIWYKAGKQGLAVPSGLVCFGYHFCMGSVFISERFHSSQIRPYTECSLIPEGHFPDTCSKQRALPGNNALAYRRYVLPETNHIFPSYSSPCEHGNGVILKGLLNRSEWIDTSPGTMSRNIVQINSLCSVSFFYIIKSRKIIMKKCIGFIFTCPDTK